MAKFLVLVPCTGFIAYEVDAASIGEAKVRMLEGNGDYKGLYQPDEGDVLSESWDSNNFMVLEGCGSMS